MFYGKLKVFSHSKIQSRILFCRQRSIICTPNTKPIITMSIVAKLKILVVSTHSTVFRGFNILFNIFPENDKKCSRETKSQNLMILVYIKEAGIVSFKSNSMIWYNLIKTLLHFFLEIKVLLLPYCFCKFIDSSWRCNAISKHKYRTKCHAITTLWALLRPPANKNSIHLYHEVGRNRRKVTAN